MLHNLPRYWGLAMNMIFEVLGENKKYIEFYHTVRARPPRARGPCNMARQLVRSNIEWRGWDTLDPGVHSGIDQDLAHAVCD